MTFWQVVFLIIQGIIPLIIYNFLGILLIAFTAIWQRKYEEYTRGGNAEFRGGWKFKLVIIAHWVVGVTVCTMGLGVAVIIWSGNQININPLR